MKAVLLGLLSGMILAGCATTSGEWNKALVSNQPYLFTHHMSVEQATNAVKRILLTNSWELSTDELVSSDRFIVTVERRLADDEFIRKDELFGGLTGGDVYVMHGRLKFLLRQGELEFSSQGRKQNDQPVIIVQGDPLMMKYRRLLESEGFTVINEQPSAAQTKRSR